MEYAGDTQIGLVRKVNQDSILLRHKGHIAIFAVADGMGGHTDGEKASGAITQALDNWWQRIEKGQYEKNLFSLVNQIKACIGQANQMIYDTYKDKGICGSTASILLLYEESYAVFHVGDSRIYKLEKRHFSQVTMDEVWENDIRTKKKFTLKEILNSNKRGKLINAIGTAPELMMTVKTDCLNEHMIFLLCSDGLYKMVNTRFLVKTLKKVNKGLTTQEAVEKLMQKVYSQGAKDNVSILLIKTGK